ncbi:MAG: thermonuclease family protein [Niabella sp.]|nr:thermonuclease family protein [Niabella sp.]
MKKTLFLFIFLFSILTFYGQTVKVVGISDGDTFTALFADRHTERIRLYGIDCPEGGQPFGNVAKKFLSDLIYKKSVEIKVKDTDKYGRTVALVYVDSATIANEELLKAGLAWHYTYYDKNPKWAAFEAEARGKKLGLWGGSETPVEPWEWRNTKAKIF